MMGVPKVIVLSTVFLAAFYAAVSFPEATLNAYRVAHSELPKLVDVFSRIAIKARDYCATDLGKDLSRFIKFGHEAVLAVGRLVGPLLKSICRRVWSGLVAIHDNAMSYTDDALKQILGTEDSLLPQHVAASRHRLLSLILLAIWLLTGILTISRMTYNKFFLVMSGTFLLHAVFGPVWCVRRMAFLIGLCMWIGSSMANRPIPAAVAVLILFLLTGIRKWRKRVATVKSAEDLVMFNKSIEQRMESLEKKLDIVLAKVEFLVDKVPERTGCRHA